MQIAWLFVIALIPWSFVLGGSPEAPIVAGPPFEDGWVASIPSDVVNDGGTLTLNTPGVVYVTHPPLRFGESIVYAEADITEADAAFLGVRIQANPPISGYLLDVTSTGDMQLVQLDSGGDTVLATGRAGFPISEEDTIQMCCELRGQRLRGWVWPGGNQRPDLPNVNALLADPIKFTDGQPALGARSGEVVYSKVAFDGDAFRPRFLGLLPLSKEPRFRITWPSEPNEIYRIDVSTDRVVWETLYLTKAEGTSSVAVIPPPATQGAFFRIVSWSAQALVAANIDLIVPTAPRFAVAWASSDERVYGFEWSQDLITWQRFGELAVPGADGETISTTVLPLPEPLKAQDAEELYFRIIDLDDETSFGLAPVRDFPEE